MPKKKKVSKKKKTAKKNPAKNPAENPAENMPKASKELEAERRKSVLLDLVVKKSTGVDEIILIDSIDLDMFAKNPDAFIEVPTRNIPGIRFIILRNHNGQK